MKRTQNQAVMMENAIKNSPDAHIEWNNATLQEWEASFSRIKRSNLLQFFPYAKAMALLNNQRVSNGIIYINGQEAGLVQILEAGIINNAIHGVILDRGPLWFDGYGSLSDFEVFVAEFSKTYPKRFGRKIRFIPEFEDSAAAKQVLASYGYRSSSKTGYETIWLDLNHDLETLRKKLNPKWRNKLNQAERKELDIVWSDEGANFSWLMASYKHDKKLRGYDGPSVKTIIELAKQFSGGKNMLIGTAMLDKQPIAAILLFIHGNAATYQIGYTSDIGRDNRAHYMLLWSALSQIKERNINDLDLGGVNDGSAQGVKTFKKGMGGIISKTLGLYH